MEKPLLQVISAEPQNITHFLSFNLPFSMGKRFWSPHPDIKHAHYSIMRAAFEAVLESRDEIFAIILFKILFYFFNMYCQQIADENKATDHRKRK